MSLRYVLIFALALLVSVQGRCVWAQQEEDISASASGEIVKTFHGYTCTDDCSGHKAGYNWAARKGLTSEDQCGGRSNSFIEGCLAYVREQVAQR